MRKAHVTIVGGPRAALERPAPPAVGDPTAALQRPIRRTDERLVAAPRPILAVVPSFIRSAEDMQVLLVCLVTLRETAPHVRVLVVDDASPAQALVDQLAALAPELGVEVIRRDRNAGFATTTNVGLREALATGADALMVNADMEFVAPGWLEALLARTDTQGRPAAVVGARLLYPSGRLQHAGVYYSLLAREFAHRMHHGPGDLPEALEPCRCPVTAALALVRHETLEAVGLLDEGFDMAAEDMDYCLRVFAAGLECIYEPAAVAVHHESLFRGTPDGPIGERIRRSHRRLHDKHPHTEMAQWMAAVA